jgi:hypothetical protein
VNPPPVSFTSFGADPGEDCVAPDERIGGRLHLGRERMIRTRRRLAGAAVALALAAPAAAAPNANAKLVKRGEYLVRLGGCADCHTPVKFDPTTGMPVPDLSRAFSGHPEGAPDPAGTYAKPDIGVIGPTFTSFALPFGIVYSANITSDPATGIGSWTAETFIETMRTGMQGGGGNPVLPPMPWMSLAGATDEDLRAIFAYLLSTKPVRNAVPEPKVPPEAVKQIAASYEKLRAAGAHAAKPASGQAPAAKGPATKPDAAAVPPAPPAAKP